MQYMEFVMGTFDHSHIIKELKFHTGGHSSSVTLVTYRMFIKPMVPNGFPLFRFSIARLDTTYVHQKIPSSYSMPAFEDITSITPDVISKLKYCTVNSSTDINGARVEQYVKLVLFAHKMKKFHCTIPFWCNKFQFQNADHYNSMIELRVINCLNPLNEFLMDYRPSRWIIKVGGYFQPNSTNIWRNGGNITESSALLPPIILYEDLTK